MPNHVHGIIVITEAVGARHASPLPRPAGPSGTGKGSLGAIVGSFKSSITKSINDVRRTPGAVVWQRNYFEHIIRDERELRRVEQYILDNPLKWALDKENPIRP